MDIEKLFQPLTDRIYLRLVLEQWTGLPAEGTKDCHRVREWVLALDYQYRRILDVQRRGDDLFVLARLEPTSTAQSLIELIRSQKFDEEWQRMTGLAPFEWVGGYTIDSMLPATELEPQMLVRDARRHKRDWMESMLKRTLKHDWHEAADPEALGIEFLACVRGGRTGREGNRFRLIYRKPGQDRDEAWAAAHLNTRIRVPGTQRFFESGGWRDDEPHFGLVFHIPSSLLPEPPAEMEVWWFTDVRIQVTLLPCHEPEAATEPGQGARGTAVSSDTSSNSKG